MDGGHQLVRRGGDDGATAYRLSIGVFPEVPQSSEGEGLAALERDIHRGLLSVLLLPLVEAIGDDQAALRAQKAFEARFLGERLRPGIDHPCTHRLVLCPGGDQTPAQLVEVSVTVTQDGHHLLRWSDVVTWRCLQGRGNAKYLGYFLHVNGECITTTHGFSPLQYILPLFILFDQTHCGQTC